MRTYYARNLTTDGSLLVYQAAPTSTGWTRTDRSQRVDIHLSSSRSQSNRRFVSASKYLHSATLSADGIGAGRDYPRQSVCLRELGRSHTAIGRSDGVRYRLLTWLHDRKL